MGERDTALYNDIREMKNQLKNVDKKLVFVEKTAITHSELISKIIDTMLKHFKRVDQNFVNINKNFDQINKKFSNMDKRLDRIESGLTITKRNTEIIPDVLSMLVGDGKDIADIQKQIKKLVN